jgi:hypothetical protein
MPQHYVGTTRSGREGVIAKKPETLGKVGRMIHRSEYREVAELVSLCRGEAQEASQSTMYGGEGCQQHDQLGE